MHGGFPKTHSVNYVEGVSHDGLGMFQSKAGLERLFFINLNGTESPTAVGDDDESAVRWAQIKHAMASGAQRVIVGKFAVFIAAALVAVIAL